MTPLLRTGLRLLTDRAIALEARVSAGDEDAWPGYLDVLRTLAALDRPERGAMLTTSAMAERLGITPKSLLRRAAKGEIQPALKAGKLIRWKGTEAVAALSGPRPCERSRMVARRVASRVATRAPRSPREAVP
jgi:hypothetical protein